MCKFFSVISDGKGDVKFFKPEDVVKIIVDGNKENYDFNSHTSLSHFLGIKAEDEEKYNKYEYSPEKKEFTEKEIFSKDDSSIVLKNLTNWFNGKDINYLKNLYENRGVNLSNGVNRSNGVNLSNGVHGSNGVNRSDGVNWSNGINLSKGVHGSDGVSGSNGVNRSNGINLSKGVHGSNGINLSDGVSGSDGVNWSKGVHRSYGVIDSLGINKGIFVSNKKNPPLLFGKEITEDRYNSVIEKIQEFVWKPTFNNLHKLYLKSGSSWKDTPIRDAEEISKKEAWADMPKELLDYIRSLPEFDAKIFEEITGLKV